MYGQTVVERSTYETAKEEEVCTNDQVQVCTNDQVQVCTNDQVQVHYIQ